MLGLISPSREVYYKIWIRVPPAINHCIQVWRFSHMRDHHENTNDMYQLHANTLCGYRMIVYVYTTKHAAAAAAAARPLGRN